MGLSNFSWIIHFHISVFLDLGFFHDFLSLYSFFFEFLREVRETLAHPLEYFLHSECSLITNLLSRLGLFVLIRLILIFAVFGLGFLFSTVLIIQDNFFANFKMRLRGREISNFQLNSSLFGEASDQKLLRKIP